MVRYFPGQRALAEELAASVRRMTPLPGMPPGLGRSGAPPIVIQLAPDEARFDSLTGGRAPEWSAGVAYPEAGVIVLPAYASGRASATALRQTLRHELAHVALRRHLRGAAVPRWFDEGYARYAAGEWDAEAGWQLRLAFALGRAPPLDSLALRWPAREPRARLAYLLATTAVVYLVEASGERGLAAFLARWREGGDMERALRATYGVTSGQLEEDWRRFVERRYGWAAFFGHAAVFWFFATLALVLLWLRRRRTNRERLERLRATEPPDAPAYWLGEPAGPGEPDGEKTSNGS